MGPISPANYTLTAIYQGSSKYNTSTATNTLTVRKKEIFIKAFINPSKVVTGKKIKLTAVLTRKDNLTVTGGKVVFKLNHKTIKDENRKPIYKPVVNGKVTIETNIPWELMQKHIQ